ncbi:MAG: hypothetical protein U1A78_17905 [Polyangia bacterium]
MRTNDRWLRLRHVGTRGRQLSIRAELDGHELSTSIWYEDVDFDRLGSALGETGLLRVAFHIASFELNKLCSFAPTHLSFGPYARFVTPAFAELWYTVLDRVWAQWRWEHDLPDYKGPLLTDEPVPPGADLPRARFLADDRDEALLFFGGGKDSLVAARLLSAAGVAWSSSTYAHSIYGRYKEQHALVDGLLDTLRPQRRHRQWIADEVFAAPLPELLPQYGVRSLLAAETPSSVFAALPTVLSHGYRQVVLAHEHSANRGNLIWSRTGEEVNHQWGKSWEAERLLAGYIERELLPGFRWFSILQPLSDVLIFELLRGAGNRVLYTHSCNVKKPWCRRCAKCAYVALGYAAHLPDGLYARIFPEDVLDLPENEEFFRQMIGLDGHTPFECIGEIDEARLALALCAARGHDARAVRMFQEEGGSLPVSEVLRRYAVVHGEAPHGIPEPLAARVLPLMQAAAADAVTRITSLL